MKKIIISTFCLLITLITFAQLPEYVISNEWETSNQQKTEKLMNDWKNLILEMDENAPRTFLLTEMDGTLVKRLKVLLNTRHGIKILMKM